MKKLTNEKVAELRKQWFDPFCCGFEQELVRGLLDYIQDLETEIKNPRYGVYADLVAGLILAEPMTGEAMVVTSPPKMKADGSFYFLTKAIKSGTYWKHTIKTEEINGLSG